MENKHEKISFSHSNYAHIVEELWILCNHINYNWDICIHIHINTHTKHRYFSQKHTKGL